MIQLHKKQGGFSILAVILVIVAVVVAIGIWALSGSSNTSQNNAGNYDTTAMAVIQDGLSIKSAYDQYIIQGNLREYIIYMPNVNGTDRNPNILDPIKGITIPNVSSKALRAGYNFPEGHWLYTAGYENIHIPQADSQAVVLFGLNEETCKSINKNIHGTTAIPANYGNLNLYATGMTKENPNIPYFNGEVDNAIYPNLMYWQNGCVKLGDDNTYVYFQAMTPYRY